MFLQFIPAFSSYCIFLELSSIRNQFSVFSGRVCSSLPPYQLVLSSFEDECSQGEDNVTPQIREGKKFQIFRSYRCHRQKPPMDRQSINGSSISSVDGPANFQFHTSNFSLQSRTTVDQYGPSVDSRPVSQLRRWTSQLSVSDPKFQPSIANDG
uniref:Uncharacterized protein n=1 Tax=Solanum tuberosum TaxID=4113 RepID=M1DGW0_SOLTU